MIKRLLAVLAVVAAFTFAAATPSPAGVVGDVSLAGEAECIEPGTIAIEWTITIGFFISEASIDSAVLSGAAEGDITDSFAPNPMDFGDDTSIGSSVVSGDTVGTVTLDVTMTIETKGSVELDLSADVELDGSCEAPPTTEESTTSSSVAATGATRPTFTG